MPKTLTTLLTFSRRSLTVTLVFTVFACLCGGLADAQVTNAGGLTVFNVQNPQAHVDFVNAKAMPLPSNPTVLDPTQAMIAA